MNNIGLQLKKIIGRLHQGEAVESVRDDFVRQFGHVSAQAIADAERTLMEEGMPAEEIQRLCDVHAAVFEGSVEEVHLPQQPDQTPGHPAHVFLQENVGLEQLLSIQVLPALEVLKTKDSADARAGLEDAVDALSKLENHYARKENLFFPYLEKAGITAPPKVMWGVDDEIRSQWKQLLQALRDPASAQDQLLRQGHALVDNVRSMITKENNILMPMLLSHITPQEWVVIGASSPEIGFSFNGALEGTSPSDAAQWLLRQQGNAPQEDAFMPLDAQDAIRLPSGQLNAAELTAMLNTMPNDITFIGADDRVRYFSQGKHPVFARTLTIIGRDVRLCHPPKSVPVVEKLLEDFKQGRKDEDTHLLKKGKKTLLIRYHAVRDKDGEYLGTLETTEEISALLRLAQQTLDSL